MLKLSITKDASSFLDKLQAKQFKQVTGKVFDLLNDPYPGDHKKMSQASDGFLRTDIGEFRIVYRVDGDILRVAAVGKRNDDEVYRKFGRK